MNTTRILTVAVAALPILLRAQSGGPFELTLSTIGTGGGASSGGQFSLCGTIGQPDAGLLSGGQFTLEGGFWSGLSIVQTPGAPFLKIKLLGNGQAVVSWPVGVTGFLLEEAPCCSSGAWTTCPDSIIDTAVEHTVTVSATNVMKVFRLKK